MSDENGVVQELFDAVASGDEADQCRAIVAVGLSESLTTDVALQFLASSTFHSSAALRHAHVVAFAHLVRLRGESDLAVFSSRIDDVSRLFERTGDQVGTWQDAMDDASVFSPPLRGLLIARIGIPFRSQVPYEE